MQSIRRWGEGLLLILCLLYGSTAGAGILVIAPHPDDDILIAAGIIAGAVQRQEPVNVVYMTNGDADEEAGGINLGYQRQGEAVTALGHLGMAEDNAIFLGYPDNYLRTLYDDHVNETDVFTSPVTNQSTSYGNRGLGRADYHVYRYGAHANYNRYNILLDLADIISRLKPDHIFTISPVDWRPDHNTTYALTRLALNVVFNLDPNYNPTIHTAIVWSVDTWPNALNPTTYFAEIPDLSQMGLSWSMRESIDVPLAMQSTNYPTNPKYLAITAHASQGGANGFLGQFIHKDEIFWSENVVGSNHPPIPAAGFDQTVGEGSLVTLDGSGSQDPDANFLSYQWSQVGGIPVQLFNFTSAQSSFVAPTGLTQDATLTFQLVVGDGTVSSVPDLVNVTVSTVLPSYNTLTVSILPSGAGSVLINPNRATYNTGEQVTLTATAAAGYAFNNWSGDAEGTQNPVVITMNSSKVVTANFAALTAGVLSVTPASDVNASGTQGGPFSLSHALYTLQNTGEASINWNAAASQNWLDLSSTSGSLLAGETTTITVSLNNNANNLTPGTYSDIMLFTNTTNGDGSTTRGVSLVVQDSSSSGNIAPLATVTASSENPSTGQLAVKAVDGVTDGYPGDSTREWATMGGGVGSWIQLNWSTPYTVDRVILYDRPNSNDRILSATLLFSDGSSLLVGPLDDTGGGTEYTFSAKTITSLSMTVNTVSDTTQNIGLAEVQVYRISQAGISLASLSLNPASIVGGNPSQGTVTLTGPAPIGGVVVSLSSNTSVADVPGNVTIPAGSTTATFTVSTNSVAGSSSVTISGTYSGTTRNATLTVTPVAVTLTALSLSPTSVVGGNASQGTVTLSGPAPSGGVVVSLSSSNTSVADVPGSVTVPAGSTTATFTVSTNSVAGSSSVTISGSYGGTTRNATLAITPPLTVTIGQPSTSLTNSGPVTYTVTYTNADTISLASTHVSLIRGGTANATGIDISGSGNTTRTVTISGIVGNGTLGISIGPNTATDAAGNPVAGAGPSAIFDVDNTAPTVGISAPSASIVNGGSVTYTITYSNATNVFLSSADVTLNRVNTANGLVTVTGSGNSVRTVTISGIVGNGTLGISIGPNTASDAAGNSEAAGAGPSATFTVDTSRPAVSITSSAPDPTNLSPIPLTITFSEVVTNFIFTTAGVSVGNGSISCTVPTGFNTTYSCSVTPAGTGTVTVTVLANAASDAASNGNTASTTLTRTFDSVNPTAAISSTITGTITNVASIPVSVHFSKTVTGFTDSDVSIINGTIGSFSVISGADYSFNVTPAGSNVTVTVNIPAGAAQDAFGNGNSAAAQFSITYDMHISSGDLNGDGNGAPNAEDALRALQIASGIISPTANDILYGDVAPLVNGHPNPDGIIDLADAVAILRRVAGLTTW